MNFIYENIYDHIPFTLLCLSNKEARQAALINQYLVTMLPRQLTAGTWQGAFSYCETWLWEPWGSVTTEINTEELGPSSYLSKGNCLYFLLFSAGIVKWAHRSMNKCLGEAISTAHTPDVPSTLAGKASSIYVELAMWPSFPQIYDPSVLLTPTTKGTNISTVKSLKTTLNLTFRGEDMNILEVLVTEWEVRYGVFQKSYFS